MKTAKVTLADATYYLAFDGEAMFTLRDDFGGTQLAIEAIEQDIAELVVREEADVKKISRELYNMQKSKSRSKGVSMA